MSTETIRLRPVRATDEEFLVSVYRSTREAELSQVPWNDDQKDAFVRSQFAAQTRHYRQEHPGANHDIICWGEVEVGRLYLARNDALHILDITVLPAYRKRGIGSTLIGEVIAEAARDQKPVTIYVESFNASLNLFRKLGFETLTENGFLLLLKRMPGV